MDKMKLETFKIKDDEHDEKIDALNVFATITIADYLGIANSIKNNNDFQRRKVSKPSTIYGLLKEDLKNGCLLPPIVLALDVNSEKVGKYSAGKIDYTEIEKIIRQEAEELKILDGLQRTNVLLDLESELNSSEGKEEAQILIDQKTYKKLLSREIRVEVYLNVSRFGILYRMLTLNTGQTPMSLRHQIEILYSDYYTQEKDGVILLRDAFESTKAVKVGQYRFSDIVEGVTSFIDGSEFTLDRFDLLDYIKTLKKLSAEDKKVDIFSSFVNAYHLFLSEIITKSESWSFDYDNLSDDNLSYFPIQRVDKETGDAIRTAPFGNNVQNIFTKSQVLTGFGAAMSFLKQKEIVSEINDVLILIPKIYFEGNPSDALDTLMVRLEQIRKESKKIGESQRTFFKFFFVSLFNSNDTESYLVVEKAIDAAYRKTS